MCEKDKLLQEAREGPGQGGKILSKNSRVNRMNFAEIKSC